MKVVYKAVVTFTMEDVDSTDEAYEYITAKEWMDENLDVEVDIGLMELVEPREDEDD